MCGVMCVDVSFMLNGAWQGYPLKPETVLFPWMGTRPSAAGGSQNEEGYNHLIPDSQSGIVQRPAPGGYPVRKLSLLLFHV